VVKSLQAGPGQAAAEQVAHGLAVLVAGPDLFAEDGHHVGGLHAKAHGDALDRENLERGLNAGEDDLLVDTAREDKHASVSCPEGGRAGRKQCPGRAPPQSVGAQTMSLKPTGCNPWAWTVQGAADANPASLPAGH